MGSGEGSRHSEDRLKWIDALNKWIPEQNQSRAGYVSFVGNAPMVEKLLREVKQNKFKRLAMATWYIHILAVTSKQKSQGTI